MDWVKSMVPHACLYIDSPIKATLEGLEMLAYSSENPLQREIAEEDLERLWKKNYEHFNILPCLSVRSGLDLYLSVMCFPPGSEIIMSAINIPSMGQIIEHHELKVRACDVDIETLAPSLRHLKSLINAKTVALLVAHVYGKRFQMNPIISVCQNASIAVLEDCAEAFNGLNYRGHSESDVVFFSFGTIKVSTAFGGAILKISKKSLYDDMKRYHDTYPIQSKFEYGRKLAKYLFISPAFNNTVLNRYGVSAFHFLGMDHKEVFVPLIRGFQSNLFANIRRQPSVALLNNLTIRLSSFDEKEHRISVEKGDYVAERLPSQAVAIGRKAFVNNYWLFPILVEKPKKVIEMLNDLGVDSTDGSTQLSFVRDSLFSQSKEQFAESGNYKMNIPNARFIMDHVVYLPVQKLVPYTELDKILSALKKTLTQLSCKPLTLPKEPKNGVRLSL